MSDFGSIFDRYTPPDRKLITPEPEAIEEEEYCFECDNGGWVEVHSDRPPSFDICQKCYNPHDYPSP